MDRLSGRRTAAAVLAALGAVVLCIQAAKPRVKLVRDDRAGTLAVLIGGREALVYRYGADLDLAHYWPLRSPSGQNMLVEKTEPYPHHRSFWFADTVRLQGEERDSSFYNALTSGVRTITGDFGPPFRDRVRHLSFPKLESVKDGAVVEADLVWETDGRPVLDEHRRLVVRSLGDGEYLLDLTWTLVAAHGDVLFKSDDVHYAWPYLRLAAAWSGDKGGKIVADSGAAGQEATNLKPALWIDYSNTVEGRTEGIAVFQWPDGREHRFLTREYGTFGPRRSDELSGKPFTLIKGESLTQRVGVLVHKGDIASGRVRERYEEYVKGAPRPVTALVEDAAAGTLTVTDAKKPVLTYRFGDQLAAGLDEKQVRSCYIHPLYSLDGEVLTADFPADHLHHHGVFWAWPSVKVRDAATQTWQPAEPSLRQRFVKWIAKDVVGREARLAVENDWILGGKEKVAKETVALVVHEATSLGRAIDVEIVLRPIGGPIELRGAAEENKGYGGLCLRSAPLLKGAAMTTDAGPLFADSTGKPLRWADLSTPDLGVAVFVSLDHPGSPVPWLVRNSYAGILNPSWPALAGAMLAPGVPVSLRYRLYVHRGDVVSGRVKEAYEAYAAGREF
jgi:hypothetical protein